MKERILILGAGLMQMPAIRAARSLGLESVVVDGNAEAHAASLADRFVHIDLRDTEGILALAEKLHAESAGLAGVFTCGTDFSAAVAFVAEKLELPGIPYETALDASDKERMRTRLDAAGVPQPKFKIITTSKSAKRYHTNIDIAFPVVVKPVDNMGARGCRKVNTEAELGAALAEALSFSRSGRAIVEEYMEGDEFSIDAVIYHEGSLRTEKKIVMCGIADRHIFFPPFFIEMGHTMPSGAPREVRDAVLDVFTHGITALGLGPGAAKGDIKYAKQADGSYKAMVGEIAARLSGGYMSGWTYPYSSGVDAVKAAVEIAVGREPSGLEAHKHRVAAERAFISIPGRIKAFHNVKETEAMEHVNNVYVMRNVGDDVVFPVNNVTKCGNVIASAENRKVAIDAAENAARNILVELEFPNADTEKFIWGGARGYPPPAYTHLGGNDYMGRTWQESLRAIEQLCTEEERRILARTKNGEAFRRAVFRGGYQGGHYFVRQQVGSIV